MFEYIKSDLMAYTKNGSFFKKLKCFFLSHSFHVVLLIRIGMFIRKSPFVGPIFRVLIEYIIRIVYASDISLNSKIGRSFIIMHGHDIVIGSSVIIGNHVKIFNGVTLGNKNTENDINQQPTIGNNVVIGTGAKILGAVVVGDKVKIGANSVVLINVPTNSIAIGVPARIVKND